ncbi:MAG: cell wall-binding repeat-containing protein [Coriobacteriia bacterium]|nr:cell wall-binding repeat-containing protein [Coriobacteriia bacterium]
MCIRSRVVLWVLVVCLVSIGLMPAGATGTLTMAHVTDWGTSGPGEGQFDRPTGIATDKWGNVYVAGGEGTDHRVQMFSSDGDFIDAVGTTGSGSALLDSPVRVATDRWGFVYVAEKGNGGRVSVFFPELYGGTAARTWSGTGADETQIMNPIGLAVSLGGSVYTAENGDWVQRWTPHGEYYTSWSTDGLAAAIGVSQDDEVYVANDVGGAQPHTVAAYTPWGGFLRRWGGLGIDPGQMKRPYGVSVDGAGNVFVIESEGNRGQVFTPTGGVRAVFGSIGSGPGQFLYPYGVAAGPDRTVYVADTFNSRVSKWSVTTPAAIAEVAGASRYATAKAASEKAFPPGSQSEYAVVASGGNWPDALGGAALAGVLGAPLLLTDPDTLSPEVSAEISRLNVQEIYVLGGELAVKPAVYDALAALVSGPGDIERLAGGTRYATSNRIAEEVIGLLGSSYDGTAFVATGGSFPDALAASPISAANGWPIFLTNPLDPGLTPSVKTAMENLGVTHGYIAGETGAVSEAVGIELNTAFIEFTRYGGKSRYETAAAIAEAGFEGMGMLWSRPAIATGQNFPDALAGGVMQGSDYSVMLLTPKDSLHEATAAALSANADSIYELRFLGGNTVISTATRTAAAALLP